MQFSITSLWNGTEIVDHEPALVNLAVNDNGDLVLSVKAPLFNSPIMKEESLQDTCPQRPFLGFWNDEVSMYM